MLTVQLTNSSVGVKDKFTPSGAFPVKNIPIGRPKPIPQAFKPAVVPTSDCSVFSYRFHLVSPSTSKFNQK
jgi:hypothetical protein